MKRADTKKTNTILGQAHKICTQNGTWYRHPETNRYWSNYTTCVDTVDLEVSGQLVLRRNLSLQTLISNPSLTKTYHHHHQFRTKILKIYVIGNTISLVALLLSLIIFITFKWVFASPFKLAPSHLSPWILIEFVTRSSGVSNVPELRYTRISSCPL